MALGLRVYGINWDQGQHLHPDERFLTMVGSAEKIPLKLSDYLDPTVSTLNPYNIGYKFFVYGTLPLTLNKILAVVFKLDNYNDFTLLGRFLSAFFDVGTLFLVYKIVELWGRAYKLDKKLKYLSAFFYAISVLPIQHSHFFVSESFLTFFIVASFYCASRFYYRDKLFFLVSSAIFFGMALGTKISALYVFPLVLFFIIFGEFKSKKFPRLVINLFLFMLLVFLSLRISDPKFFTPSFKQNLIELNSQASDKAFYFPPAVQWFDKKPVIFALTNIAFFGLGIPYFLLACLGFYKFIRLKKIEISMVAFWLISFFLYQSTRFVPSMRYFIFLYPFFAIFAGMGFLWVAGRLGKYEKWGRLGVLVLVLIWPVSFMSIYSRPHSRVTASYWIHQNIPENSYLAEEHWDDWLPVSLPDIKNKVYKGEQMPVFAPDTPEKWQQMDKILSQADYIIFTSNRGYGSIMPQPKMYPKMSKFYKDLFAGKLEFKKVKEFTSYPMFDDQWSEEAFTVYDHPKVTIFKKL